MTSYHAQLIHSLKRENERLRNGIAFIAEEGNCDDTWDFLHRLLEGKEHGEGLPDYRIKMKKLTNISGDCR